MYWHFLSTLLLAGIGFIVVFWVAHLILSLPYKAFIDTRAAQAWNLASNIMGIYILCIWPAYCSMFTGTVLHKNSVNYVWLYYLTALVAGISGIHISIRTQLRNPVIDSNNPVDGHITRVCEVDDLRRRLTTIGIIALIIFLIWPTLPRYIYAWLYTMFK